MIEYRKGDLLDTPNLLIAHGCNAQGVMGSGVAKAIRDKWPEVYTDYKNVESEEGLSLGSVISSHIYSETGKLDKPIKKVYSCITQEFYGRDGKRYVKYTAIRKCMQGLARVMTGTGHLAISMPKIGAGLGGGDWSVIEKIIEEELGKFTVTIWEL